MSEMKSLRYDSGKLRVGLVPPEIIIELARVYTAGAVKYNDNNWRDGGMDWKRCLDSGYRHLLKWQMMLETDPETGCHHLAQASWNFLTIMIYQMQGLGMDCRAGNEKITIDEDFNWIVSDNPKTVADLNKDIELRERLLELKKQQDAAQNE